MINKKISRRKLIGSSSVALLGIMSGYGYRSDQTAKLITGKPLLKNKLPFRISMNTSTIMSYQLPVEEQIDMVAEAGFDGIELWVRDVNTYIEGGGTPEALSERLRERNLILENMIGFAQWFSDDITVRQNGIDQLRKEMLMIARLGGKFIAAPVMGLIALDTSKMSDYAGRYRTILQLADETGVTPILELWGHAALSKLADCAQIVIATGHPKASMLLDFYHLYRGGNSWDTLDVINAGRLPVIHINDYPENPPREQLVDGDRIFPGDGICPFDKLIPELYNAGFRGAFSVELFNQGYWDTMDVKTILQQSYEKTRRLLTGSMHGVVT